MRLMLNLKCGDMQSCYEYFSISFTVITNYNTLKYIDLFSGIVQFTYFLTVN